MHESIVKFIFSPDDQSCQCSKLFRNVLNRTRRLVRSTFSRQTENLEQTPPSIDYDPNDRNRDEIVRERDREISSTQEMAVARGQDRTIDDAIAAAIKDMETLKSKSSAFHRVNTEFLNSGKIEGANLQKHKRMKGEHNWSTGIAIHWNIFLREKYLGIGENPVVAAQETSALYSGKDNPAAVLQNKIKDTKNTIGKGWFDIEVRLVWVFL